ncbi:MAG: 23S rRNA (adenine(2503)-C(2))-methyltransferase RlmN [Patescibacteria group bacterium]|nr:23S rRNA (adenine(2503)-C(2))-methyltransferase RlmN [Patescibacteria group bacterium]
MDSLKLQQMLESTGEKPFRAKQIKAAVYDRLISDWDEATDLSYGLRENLKVNVPLSTVEPVTEVTSKRGDAIKVSLRLADANEIETVLMRHRDGRNTVCVSSQAGCAMKCAFCATGKAGFRRNLTADEIIDQILHFARKLRQKKADVTNVVFMGMGEPMHNFDAVMDAIRTINSKNGLEIGARRISVSTCGIVPGISRLADESLQINLAISLHAPNDALRSRLMPANDAYPIGQVMRAVESYTTATNRRVMFEYTLIDGINDKNEHADALADLLGDNHLYHVNLIRFHRTGGFSSSPRDRRDTFLERLKTRGISATHRVSFGEDIRAACGQLAGQTKRR